MFSAPTWARWSIDLPACNKAVDPEDTSDEAKALRGEQQTCNEEHTGIFPLPGLDAGSYANGFAGGSNIAVAAKSQHPELAKSLLRIMFTEEFQNMLGENGLIPGNTAYAASHGRRRVRRGRGRRRAQRQAHAGGREVGRRRG